MRTYEWWRKLLAVGRRARRLRRQSFTSESLVPQLAVVRLEERRVLNADAAPVDVLMVDAGDAADDGQSDVIQVEQNAGQIRVSVNGHETHLASADQISEIRVQGSVDNDVLVADLLAGVQLTFDGGAGDDAIHLNGDENYNSVNYELAGAGDTQIDAYSDAGAAAIHLRGVEHVTDSLDATTRRFSFEDTGRGITLSDAAAVDGSSRLATDELRIDFTNPLDSLRVDSTGEASDHLIVDGLDKGFDADLFVSGSANDVFSVRGATDLGAGDLSVSTGSIVLSDSLASDHAVIDLQAESSVTVERGAHVYNDAGRVDVKATTILLDGGVAAFGGVVELDSGAEGVTVVGGWIDVSAAGAEGQGGAVHVLGNDVQLVGAARIDASGASGGGTVLVGGGRAGLDSAVRNARQTFVGADVVVTTDATVVGLGGTAIFWADRATYFHGAVRARGGANGGDGGFVEISGKRGLRFTGHADLSAPNGRIGTLLFDPENIIIHDASDGAQGDDGEFGPGDNEILEGDGAGMTFDISETVLEGLAAGANLILEATGDITLEDLTTDGVLDLAMNAGGSVTIIADSDDDGNGGFTFENTVNQIATAGGDMTIEGATLTLGALDAGGGDILIDNSGAGEIAGVVSGAGALIMNGSGVLTLSAANTYTGATTIGDGRLEVTGSLAAGSMVSIDGGDLGGTGTTNGPVTMTPTAGGISPGLSLTAGQLTVDNDVTFAAAGAFEVDVTGDVAGAEHDQLTVTGAGRTVTLDDATLDISQLSGLADGEAIVIIDNVDATSTIAGTFAGLAEGDQVGTLPLFISYAGGADSNDVVLTFDATPTIDGDAGANIFLVELVGADLRVTVDAVVVLETPAAGITALTINGLGGNDRLTVDHSGGFVDVAVTYDGGAAGNDKLVVVGDGADTANYTPDAATTGSGQVVVNDDGGAAAMTIDFSELEPVDITGMAVATLTTPNAIDVLTLTNGMDSATNSIDAWVVEGTSGGVGMDIESAHFFGNTTVVIDADTMAGADTITVDSANNGANTNLTIESGGTIDAMTDDATADILGDTITLTAAMGGIGNATAIDVTANTEFNADTSADGSDIRIDAIGALPIGTIDAAAGSVRIVGDGDITQVAGGAIIASELGVRQVAAAGDVLLDQDNDVDQLAVDNAAVGGSVLFRNVDDLTIETVAASGTFVATSGVTTADGDAKLIVGDAAGENLAIDQAIDLGAGDLFLDVAGDVTQTATITARGLALMVDGVTRLELANDVDTLAADAGGTILYNDVDGVDVGTVTALDGTADAMTINGVTGTDVKVIAGGNVSIDAAVNLGADDLLLDVAGNVNQTGAGTITAAGLGLMVDGNTRLQLGNDVDVLAADVGGTILFDDVDDLTIDTVTVLDATADEMTITGITGFDVKLIVDGNLDINAAINLGGDDLFLAVGGDVNQAGAGTITAAGLGLMVDGVTTLALPNNVDVLAGSLGGSLLLNVGGPLSIGAVTVLDGTADQMTVGDIFAFIPIDVKLIVGSNYSVDAPINLGDGNLFLDVAGNVTQTAAVVAGGLALMVDGTTTLDLTANDVDVLAADAEDSILYTDADGVTVGSITVLGMNITGISTTNDDVKLIIGDAAGENLAINDAIDLGSGDAVLDGNLLLDVAGDVTQVATITATTGLALMVDGVTTLELANDVDIFAADAGGAVLFRDADELIVGSVTVLAMNVTGVTTTNDDVKLIVGDAAGENLAIDQAVSLGDGDLFLDVAGDLSQTATVAARGLALMVDGTTRLELANNVDTLAANAGGTILYNDVNGVNVGTVIALDGTPHEMTLVGLAGVDVKLIAGGNLSIDAAVNLGAHDLLLDVTGNVNQTGTGTITATGLALMVDGNTRLQLANNVAVLAADDGGTILYNDVDNLTIETVTVLDGTADAMTVTGVTTDNSDVKLIVGGSLLIDAPINLGSGDVVADGDLLLDVAGNVMQTATITAVTGLALMVDGATILELANNVDVIAANDNGTILFNDIDSLAVGAVTALDGTADEMTITGVTTSNDDVKLIVGGNLDVDEAVDLGGGDLFLSVPGNVMQTAPGTIAAGGLALMVGGNTRLQLANDVDRIAADVGGTILFSDVDDLAVGTVIALDGTADEMSITGITTTDDDVKLIAGDLPNTLHDLIINEAVNLGAGDLFLDVAGDVTQAAGGTITANGLALMVDGNTTLGSANDVNVFAADAGGTILFNDVNNYAIGTVTALDGTADEMSITGVTSAMDVKLEATTDLDIDAAITVNNGENLFLNVTGNVTQTAVINAAGLGLMVTGNTRLELANDVDVLAADTGGTILFNDVDDLTIDTVTVLNGTANMMTVIGITTTGDDVKLVVGNAPMPTDDLNIDAAVSLAGGDLLVDVAGDVLQTAAITAAGFALMVDGTTTLELATNNVEIIAADANDAVSYVDADNLAVGEVIVLDATIDEMTVTAITTSTDDVTLRLVGDNALLSVPDNLGVDGIDTNGDGTTGAVSLTADNMNIGSGAAEQAVDANASLVLLQPERDSVAIQLGMTAADAAGQLGLTDVELREIRTSGGLTIGRPTGDGGITVVGDLDLTAAPMNLSGGILTLQQGGGAIDVNDVLTSPVETNLTTSTGNISVGPSGAIVANGNAVTMSAAGGSIQGGAVGMPDVTAATLDALAANGIGLSTAIDVLILNNTVMGNVDIDEADDLGIHEVDQDAAGGTVNVDAGGTITVVAGQMGVTAINGQVELDANGPMSSIVVEVEIATVGGNINLLADDDVMIAATGPISTDSGDIAVAADANADADGTGGSLTVEDGGTINAGTGRIDLDADEDITLTGLTTTNVGGDAVTVTTTSGGVVDAGDMNIDITAAGGTAVIDAVTGVGSADAIETEIDMLDLDNNASAMFPAVGNVDVNEVDQLNINQLDQDAATGTVNVDAGGTITVVAGQAGVSALDGQLELDANGNLSDVAVNEDVVTAGGAINVFADNDVTIADMGDIISTSGNVAVAADADGQAVAGGGALAINDGRTINAGSGTIDLDAADDIMLTGVITANSTAAAVTITTSTGGVVDSGDANTDIAAADGTVIVDSVMGVGDANAIDTQIGTLDLDNTMVGNVDINEIDSLDINELDQDAAGGAVNIDTNNANDVMINGTITIVAGQSGVSAVDGQVELDANGHLSSIAIDNAVVTESGAVNILADNDVTFGADGRINSNMDGVGASGAVRVAADDHVAGGGEIMMAPTAAVDAGNETIDFDANENITLTGLRTTNAGNAVTVTTATGAVVDAGEIALDIDAAGGMIDIDAVTGIGFGTGELGDSEAIELDAQTLNATNTNSGGLQINDPTSLIVENVDNAGRRVVLDVGMELTDVGPATSVTAADAILRAGNGIGVSGNVINSDIDRLEADGGSGGVFIINGRDLVVADLSAILTGLTAGVTAAQNIEIETTFGSDLTVNQPVESFDESINLTSGNDATLNASLGAEQDATVFAVRDLLSNAGVTTENFGVTAGRDAMLNGVVNAERNVNIGADRDIGVMQPINAGTMSASDMIMLQAGDRALINASIDANLGAVNLDIGANGAATAADQLRSLSVAGGVLIGTDDGSITNAILNLLTISATTVRFNSLDMTVPSNQNQLVNVGAPATIIVELNETSAISSFVFQIDWRESIGVVSMNTAFTPPIISPPDNMGIVVAAPFTDTTAQVVFRAISTMTNVSLRGEATHIYIANPDGVSSDSLLVPFRITEFAGDRIDIQIAGTNILNFNQGDGTLRTPDGDPVDLNDDGVFDAQIGIMGIIVLEVLPPLVAQSVPLPEALPSAPPVAAPAAPAAPPAPLVAQPETAPPEPSAAGVTGQSEERYYQLRIVSFDADGNLVETDDQRIDLSDPELKAIAPFNPSKLPKLFKNLPADRYRIYLIEDGTERFMIEFIIERVGDEGRPVELPERIEIDFEDDDPQASRQDEVELIDPDAGAAADPIGSFIAPSIRPASAANARGGGEDAAEGAAFAEQLGRASFVSSSGLLFGAAMFSKSAKRQREAKADRRMAAFRRRLRRRAGKPSEFAREVQDLKPARTLSDC